MNTYLAIQEYQNIQRNIIHSLQNYKEFSDHLQNKFILQDQLNINPNVEQFNESVNVREDNDKFKFNFEIKSINDAIKIKESKIFQTCDSRNNNHVAELAVQNKSHLPTSKTHKNRNGFYTNSISNKIDTQRRLLNNHQNS